MPDAGPGFERTNGTVMIQIFMRAGQSTQTKQRLYVAIAAIPRTCRDDEDASVGYIENTQADWSFGFG